MAIRSLLSNSALAVPLRPAYSQYMRALWGISGNRAVRRLKESESPSARAIAEAVLKVKQPLPADEQAAISRIEDVRRQQENDPSPLAPDGQGPERDQGLTVSVAAATSKCPVHCRLLFHLIRELRPLRVLELGTNVGISSAYQAAALQLNGDDGHLWTLEGSENRIALARECHRLLDLTDTITPVLGQFEDTLAPTLEDIGTVDFAFIDGHHQYEPTLQYFDMIGAVATPAAAYLFDDIRWSDGMRRAWSEIRARQDLSTVVDLGVMGVVCQAPEKQRFVVPNLRSVFY